jgi:putative ATP-binding cassette transporter
VRDFVTSDVGWKARSLLALLVAFLVGTHGLNVLNSYVARDFMTAIADRDRGGFIWQACVYVLVFGASTLVAVLYRFCEERLALLWREWLTERSINRYLGHRAYYFLEAREQMTNPDQRIAEDTRAFTTTTLSFVLMSLNALFTVIAFAGVLYSISGLLFAVALGYATLGSVLTLVFGRPLVWLNYNQLDKEANFRSDLNHVRQHAESVVLLRREGRIEARLRQRLAALVENSRHIISVNRNLGFFTTGYNYMIQIIPALIIAPLFIRGEVEFGVITQSAIAFSQLLGAISLIVTQFQSISSFAAVVARLGSLSEAVEQAQTTPCRIETREDNERVAYESLMLHSPTDGRVLIEDLSISVPRGGRALVRSESRAAGIALFRATAGIWDNGTGRIYRPSLDAIHFVPERPYLPIGTLREALLRTGREKVVGDAEIRAALRELGIEGLIERAGGLDIEKDWEEVFSLGEQQLLAVARVLLTAPPFVLLDRIGTALETEQVPLAFKVLGEHGISYIAFEGDGEGSGAFNAVLEIAADGKWRWREVVK